MGIFQFLNEIWRAARGANGAGIDFVIIYTALGAAIWGFTLFKVFLTEGLQVASGERSQLPRILTKWLLIAGAFAVWPTAANEIWNGITRIAQILFPDLNAILDTMNGAMMRMSAYSEAETNLQVLLRFVRDPVSYVGGTVLNGLLIIIGMFALFLCYMLILINIAGSLAILTMNLVIGPVFFGLAFDRDFRSPAVQWFTATLSYFLLMPLYGLALHMAAAVAGAGLTLTISGFVSAPQIAAQLLGPFMSVGIVFSANKVVSALVGGAAGSGLGSSFMGAVGASAMLIPGGGGGMVRATAASVGQVARNITAGGNSGGAPSPAGSTPSSSTAKASQANNA